MSGNAKFIAAAPTLGWISQFRAEDQSLAVALLQAMDLVTRDAFVEGLRTLILKRAARIQGTIGLYAEREVGHRHGVPYRLFKQSKTKPKRATGVGL